MTAGVTVLLANEERPARIVAGQELSQLTDPRREADSQMADQMAIGRGFHRTQGSCRRRR